MVERENVLVYASVSTSFKDLICKRTSLFAVEAASLSSSEINNSNDIVLFME